ncbi:hypothetical protein Ddye_006224 [Dipteronia dyeriana]|uniref:BED-type domain-containing protein n=1 Tax=Dipteronia dyeriana TaxID=168575 RepID=A0AAD9XI63_9ROSI|nr:hypothetical protein Ddye_006224 [Dipteronia dyeriana]
MEEENDGDTQVENTGGDTSKEKKVVQSKPSRKRKETSKIWNVFVKLPRGNGRLRCKCKGCSKTYLCESIHGTDNMIRHMSSCTKLAHHDLKQMLLNKGSQDPRYKMSFVEFAYKKVYGIDSSELDIVRSKLLSLFNEYTFTSMSTRGSSSISLPSSSKGGDIMTDTGGDIFGTNIMREYEAYSQQEYTTVCNQKSHLELYLDEPKLEMSSNLDVLDFWKVNMIRYPDLLVMTLSESLEVDEVAEDILKLTLENSPGPSIESATSQFGD